MYLIDRLALRAGNEKGEEEADTVGCCSLRLEHVTLIPPLTIELRFLGKDSIMYEQEVEVDPQVFKNIKIFKADPKTPEDDLFDRLTVSVPGINRKICLVADFRFRMREDCRVEQASGQLYGRPDCQGLPYIQRILHLPGPIEPADAFQGYRRRKDRCV